MASFAMIEAKAKERGNQRDQALVELIAGFAIVQAKSKAETIELAKRFLKVAGDGESEIRQMYDTPAYAR